MRIPFLNLIRQNEMVKEEISQAIDSVLKSGRFVLGPKVRKLERRIARYVKSRYAVAVGSGTDALHLTLRAKGIGKNDAVITTPYTFFATAEAISLSGARPLFVDIDLESYNLDGRRLEEFAKKECSIRQGKLFHKKTGLLIKAIIPVHLFGQCVEMREILEFAQNHSLSLIEDSAQSIGAKQKVRGRWRNAGSIGEIGCFSFYPTKNLWAFGDGGMIVTQDKEVYQMVRLLHNHGMEEKNIHALIGWNSRLDEIQAAILLVNFKHLKRRNKRRQEIYLFYNERLRDKVFIPKVLPFNQSVFNQYVIRTSERDSLRAFLKKKGIETEIYYPLPIHLQPCYKDLGYRLGDFPMAEKASRENLALPIDPTLTQEEMEYIVAAIEDFFQRS